jgi:hypothetical protein
LAEWKVEMMEQLWVDRMVEYLALRMVEQMAVYWDNKSAVMREMSWVVWMVE